MRRFIREPLVHFVLLSVLIFAGYDWLTKSRDSAKDTIFVSSAELDRLASLYTVEAGTLPGPQDMQAMLSDYVEQQALVREARRLGLAEGDTVIERRLAQKLAFMITDIEEVTDPAPDELEAWFEQNQEDFREPDRISFRHVFIVDDDPERIAVTKRKLSEDPEHWRSFGDPFILQRSYSNLPEREISRIFGAEFAASLVNAPHETTEWQGPIASALGMHLVQISQKSDSMLPELSDIQDRVIARWQEEVSRERARDAINKIVARYDVEIEPGAVP